MSGQGGENAIRRMFVDYGAGFDDADATAITDLFAWPATIWQFGEGHVFEDAEELEENVEALMDVFDEAGIVLTTARHPGGSGRRQRGLRQRRMAAGERGGRGPA
jgi:hypothetical protein